MAIMTSHKQTDALLFLSGGHLGRQPPAFYCFATLLLGVTLYDVKSPFGQLKVSCLNFVPSC